MRFAEVDLNEDDGEDLPPNVDDDSDEEEEEEEEEGDDDEFIDLLDVLDGKGDIDMGSDDGKAVVSRTHSVEQEGSDLERDEESDEEDSEIESDEDPGAAEDEEIAFVPSDDDEAPEALDQLQQFVSGLEVTSKKRKAPDDSSAPNAEARARRRRLMKERTEAGDENEFRAHSSGRQYFLAGYNLTLQYILQARNSTLMTFLHLLLHSQQTFNLSRNPRKSWHPQVLRKRKHYLHLCLNELRNAWIGWLLTSKRRKKSINGQTL